MRVIMVASRRNGMMDRYLAQLADAGVPCAVITLPLTTPSVPISGCLEIYRDLTQNFISEDRLVFTDAWDMQFFGTRKELESIPDRVIWAAERNCYPEPHLARNIPGTTPFRFVNGGFFSGSPQQILEWIDRVEHHPLYDPYMLNQQWLNRRLADQDPIVEIDSECRHCYCMFLENGELGVLNGRPYSTLTETYPMFIHFNGSWPSADFDRIMEQACPRS